MATTVEILEQVRRVRQALQVASRLAWELGGRLTDMSSRMGMLERSLEQIRRRVCLDCGDMLEGDGSAYCPACLRHGRLDAEAP